MMMMNGQWPAIEPVRKREGGFFLLPCEWTDLGWLSPGKRRGQQILWRKFRFFSFGSFEGGLKRGAHAFGRRKDWENRLEAKK
jgi:hypothetical protein